MQQLPDRYAQYNPKNKSYGTFQVLADERYISETMASIMTRRYKIIGCRGGAEYRLSLDFGPYVIVINVPKHLIPGRVLDIINELLIVNTSATAA